MISKELLSEVLGKEVTYVSIIDNICEYEYKVSGVYTRKAINIYELAHEAKEWAYNQEIFNFHISISREYKQYIAETGYGFGTPHSIDFRAFTEHEAIFQCCEWVLEQIKTVQKNC